MVSNKLHSESSVCVFGSEFGAHRISYFHVDLGKATAMTQCAWQFFSVVPFGPIFRRRRREKKEREVHGIDRLDSRSGPCADEERREEEREKKEKKEEREKKRRRRGSAHHVYTTGEPIRRRERKKGTDAARNMAGSRRRRKSG